MIVGQVKEAEDVCERGIALYEKIFGPEHLELAATLSEFGHLLQVKVRLHRAVEPPHLLVAGETARGNGCP